MRYREVVTVHSATVRNTKKLQAFANAYGYCLLSHPSPEAVGDEQASILVLGGGPAGAIEDPQAIVTLGPRWFEHVIGEGTYRVEA